MNLLPRHRTILCYLLDDGGYSTQLIGEVAWPEALRGASRSRTAYAVLKELQRAGYVETIDDQRPLAWRRTTAGRAALASAAQSRTEGEGT